MHCISGSSSTHLFVTVKNLTYFLLLQHNTVANHFKKILDFLFCNVACSVKYSDDIILSEDR